MSKVLIFDTTLRDGEQSPGSSMNLQEKLRLARQLELLGVDIIEAGFPASSPGDFKAVQAIAENITQAEVAALARAKPGDIACAWEAVKKAAKPRLHVFIATSPLHMEYKLHKTPEQILEAIQAGVSLAAQFCPQVEFSAEDACRSDPDFLCQVYATAIKAGAKTVNIPDTVGYAQPTQISELVQYLRQNTLGAEKVVWSVHCHNDLGLAVANSLSAIQAGARQVEVTLGGIGERAGNAALEEVAMALHVRHDIYKVTTNIVHKHLFPSCRLMSKILGQPLPMNKAIVGENAFSHESGIHQAGVLSNPLTYEIMTPQSIGRLRSDLVIGKHSGRAAVRDRLKELGYALAEAELTKVLDAVKELADKKAHVHNEDLEALVFSEVYRVPDKYRLLNVSVQISTGSMPATAAVELLVDDQVMRLAGFGVGPIDSTFNVISQLVKREPTLEQFAINAITGGTDAMGEVTVHLTEGTRKAIGRGSDPDILVASAKAFVDALNRLSYV